MNLNLGPTSSNVASMTTGSSHPTVPNARFSMSRDYALPRGPAPRLFRPVRWAFDAGVSPAPASSFTTQTFTVLLNPIEQQLIEEYPATVEYSLAFKHLYLAYLIGSGTSLPPHTEAIIFGQVIPLHNLRLLRARALCLPNYELSTCTASATLSLDDWANIAAELDIGLPTDVSGTKGTPQVARALEQVYNVWLKDFDAKVTRAMWLQAEDTILAMRGMRPVSRDRPPAASQESTPGKRDDECLLPRERCSSPATIEQRVLREDEETVIFRELNLPEAELLEWHSAWRLFKRGVCIVQQCGLPQIHDRLQHDIVIENMLLMNMIYRRQDKALRERRVGGPAPTILVSTDVLYEWAAYVVEVKQKWRLADGWRQTKLKFLEQVRRPTNAHDVNAGVFRVRQHVRARSL